MVCGSGGGWRELDINMRMQRCKCEVGLNAVYVNAARLCSVARHKKRDAQEVKNVGLP